MLVAATVIAAVAASLTLLLLLYSMTLGRKRPTKEDQDEQESAERELSKFKAMVEEHIQGTARRLSNVEETLKALPAELARRVKPAAPLQPASPPAPPEPQGYSMEPPEPQGYSMAPPEPRGYSMAPPAPPASPVEPMAPGMPRTGDRVTTWMPERAEPPNGQAAPASPPAAEARANEKVREFVDQYREMIARPQRREIDDWADEQGGLSVEAVEDGSFRDLSREAGGLLFLLPIDDETAMVLPGGRIVADFGTKYATCLSLRPVTKRAFTLETEGDGVLRLIHPALARRDGNKWRLSRAGSISGLIGD